jgi:hypothetical protein
MTSGGGADGARARVEGQFAETGLDFGVDGFTPAEKKALLDWYRRTHGTGDLDLVRFAPFLIEHLPSAYKLSRRHQLAIPQARKGVMLPDLARVLCFLHTYVAIANGAGAVYEMIGARSIGASKALVLDVLQYAYLSAGPRGMNSVAEKGGEYLRSWPDSEPAGPLQWPPGWAPDPDRFRSGIDHSKPQLTADEVIAISEWHQRMHGIVPRHVQLFARLHPHAYKIQRMRYERAIGSVMPAQLAPLLTLHLATVRLQPAVISQATHQARVLGVRRHHVVQTLLTGLRLSIDPMVMEVVAEAVHDQLAGWEDES